MYHRCTSRLLLTTGVLAIATLIGGNAEARGDAPWRLSVQAEAARARATAAAQAARRIERLTGPALPVVISPGYGCEGCEGAALAYEIESLGAAIRRWNEEHGSRDAD
jgi:hypothetical protein